MRVFVTGATGFMGTAVVADLTAAGHQVLGLARSDESAARLAGWGVEARRGELSDPEGIAQAARECDGVIHLAYIHDFDNYAIAGATELAVVGALIEALEGTGKPLVVTSGTAILSQSDGRTENDAPVLEGIAMVRGVPEANTIAAAAKGVRSSVVRLPPSTHAKEAQGLVTRLIAIARETGVSAYVGDGANHWSAGHRDDAAKLYRLALERAEPGTRLHAVGEEGVALKAIAEAIGERLGVPVRSLTEAEAGAHFGWLSMFVGRDSLASSTLTQQRFDWRPTHPGLLTGLREGGYIQ